MCLSLHLARLQTIAAVDAVLNLLPGVRLDDGFEPARGLVFRKPAAVPVTWDPSEGGHARRTGTPHGGNDLGGPKAGVMGTSGVDSGVDSGDRSCVLEVRVTPNARRNDVRYEDGTIRIRVGTAPEDGRATEAARRALAKALGLRRTAVALKAGATSRTKQFRVDGLDETTARQRLADWPVRGVR